MPPANIEHGKAVTELMGIDFNADTETEWRTRKSLPAGA
jgi:hypothetical protein